VLAVVALLNTSNTMGWIAFAPIANFVDEFYDLTVCFSSAICTIALSHFMMIASGFAVAGRGELVLADLHDLHDPGRPLRDVGGRQIRPEECHSHRRMDGRRRRVASFHKVHNEQEG
jgi:hypothetical protein